MEKPSYTTPADELLFAAIGRLTISWAVLEASLDGIITIIHHRVCGKSIEPVMPWMLKRKLKYIRRCFSKLDALKPYGETVSPLINDILVESEMRQNIIHGVATKHQEGASQLQMVRLVRGGEFYEQRRFEVTTIDILKSAVVTNRLGGRVLAIAQNLIAKFGIDKFK